MAGPMIASLSKNCRMTSAADMRLMRNMVATPRPPRRATLARSDPRVGGLAAASRTSRATGIVARANLRYPSIASGCTDASDSIVCSTSCHNGHIFSLVQSPLICGGSTLMYSKPCDARFNSSATGVVRNVRWSQLQMLTDAPANESLAAVPPTSERASISSVESPLFAR